MNGYRRNFPKDSTKFLEGAKELNRKYKLLIVAERIIRYKVEVEKTTDKDWIKAHEMLVKIGICYQLTRVLPKSTNKMLLSALFSVVASYDTYDEIEDGLKLLLPEEIFNYFRPYVIYASKDECINAGVA